MPKIKKLLFLPLCISLAFILIFENISINIYAQSYNYLIQNTDKLILDIKDIQTMHKDSKYFLDIAVKNSNEIKNKNLQNIKNELDEIIYQISENLNQLSSIENQYLTQANNTAKAVKYSSKSNNETLLSNNIFLIKDIQKNIDIIKQEESNLYLNINQTIEFIRILKSISNKNSENLKNETKSFIEKYKKNNLLIDDQDISKSSIDILNLHNSIKQSFQDINLLSQKINNIDFEINTSQENLDLSLDLQSMIKNKQKEGKILTAARFKLGYMQYEQASNDSFKVLTMDAKTFSKENRIMIPIRYLSKALGFKLTFDKDTNTAILKDDELLVKIPLDRKYITVNSKITPTDFKPIVIKNRTYLCLSDLSKAMGLNRKENIFWNQKTKEITILRYKKTAD